MKTIIQTATPDLEKSIDFYTRLGFTKLSLEERALFTDGNFIIEINPDSFSRPGVRLFSDDWKAEAEKLGELTVVVETPDGFVTSDPNGIRVYLETGSLEVETGDAPVGITGNFAGISIEAVAVALTVEFWGALGFEQSQGDLEQGWAVFSNGGDIDISIMSPNTCPHLFFNPGLTFFNSGNNLENIAKLREAKIPITQEITQFNPDGVVDNVIINDPGGLGFFLFND